MGFFNKIRHFLLKNRKPKIDNNLTKEDVSNDLKGHDYYDDDLSQDLSQNFNYDTQHLENCCANVDQRTQTVFFNQIEIFTDGSAKRDGKSGSSFTLNNKTTEHIVYKFYRLADHTTSCVTEFAAIFQALTFLISHEVSTSLIIIYTDFRDAPVCLSDDCALKSFGRKIKVNLDIFRQKINILRANRNVIEFKWIKKDTNRLNTFADMFAKRGSRLKKINFDTSIILMKN